MYALTVSASYTQVTSIALDYCTSLRSLPDLIALEGLDSLSLYFCCRLEALPPLSPLKNLSFLNVGGCTRLKDIPALPLSISCLKLHHCSSLASLPNLSTLSECEVDNLPPHLIPWEANGRYAWTISQPPPSLWDMAGGAPGLRENRCLVLLLEGQT